MENREITSKTDIANMEIPVSAPFPSTWSVVFATLKSDNVPAGAPPATVESLESQTP